jgi:TATA-binding protein-associated factor
MRNDFGSDELGMEGEARLSPRALAKALGFVDKLPYQFNNTRHMTGLNPWDQPESFQAPTQLNPLKLHWHQLAGVHSMARNIFTSEATQSMRGILVADEVGLGKTALSVAFIAFVNQVKVIQDRNQKLPAVIRESFFHI